MYNSNQREQVEGGTWRYNGLCVLDKVDNGKIVIYGSDKKFLVYIFFL